MIVLSHLEQTECIESRRQRQRPQPTRKLAFFEVAIRPAEIAVSEVKRHKRSLSTRQEARGLTMLPLRARALPVMGSGGKVRIGVVGIGFGQHVHVPAFRLDPRCDVTAIAASRAERAREVVSRLNVPKAYGDWRALVEDPEVDAVAIATPPVVQPDIALAALQHGKAVFCEKPLAASLATARDMARAGEQAGVANMVDFIFPEIGAWRTAKHILEDGGIGGLRHVSVHWSLETYTNRAGLDSWKARTAEGGGALNNFLSHSLCYLEWFMGPVARLSAGLFRAPNDPRPGDTFAVVSLTFASGVAASVSINAAAFLGNGHRLEFYGDAGTLVLDNPTADYVKGFHLLHGTRETGHFEQVQVEEPADTFKGDGRIVAVSRLIKRFADWMETGVDTRPSLKEGLRVQHLLEAARRSHEAGCWVDVSSEV